MARVGGHRPRRHHRSPTPGRWTGVVAAVGLCGVVISCGPPRAGRPHRLLALLTVAALIVPAEQARLHTTASLAKHVDRRRLVRGHRGRLRRRLAHRRRPGRTAASRSPAAAAVVALAFPLSLGAAQSACPRHGLAQLLQPRRHPRAADPARRQPAPGRGPLDRRVLPARRAAAGSAGPAPATSSCPAGPAPAGRRRAPGSPAPATPACSREYITEGYFSVDRAQLRRHHGPGPADRRRPGAQPPLPARPR